ncbi:MAG TPA: DUF6134 family protein [Micropepsaceae bacterium]|jgi:hypothetical protein
MPAQAKGLRILPAALAMAAFALLSPAHSAAPAVQRLTYSVHHSRYGTLGTYTNAVTKSGDMTTVNTEVHIQLSILGVVLYRQEAMRQERWNAGRLVAFHGVTTVNGRSFEMNGAAQGERFVMMSPDGEITAPASVKIANPWSSEVLRGDTLLTPDRGRMENVQVKAAENTSIPINGRAMPAKRYEIDRLDGQKRYEIWMDDGDIPVMFTLYNPNGSVTFTLMP